MEITKFSRLRLIQFAEALEKQQSSITTETVQVSRYTNDTVTYDRCPRDIDMRDFLCREALQLCPEPEIKTLVDQIDVTNILNYLQDKGASEEYTAAYHKFKEAEKQLSELGWQCNNEIKK